MPLRVMLWKEWREHRVQAAILLGLGLLLLTVVMPLLGQDQVIVSSLLMTSIVLSWACGLVTGAILLANEHETHTQVFLDGLPRWRLQIWTIKTGIGVVLTSFQAVALTGSAILVARDGGSGAVFLASILAGAYGLGCGIVGSSLSRTVLAAIGWGIVTLFLSAFSAMLVGSIIGAIGWQLGRVRGGARELLQASGFVVIIPALFALSAWIHSRVDRQRKFPTNDFAIPRFRLIPPGLGLLASLWLSLWQGRALVIGLTIATLLFGPMQLVDPLIAWPGTTLLLGALMGVATLADEQFYGAFRFLAEQRLPLGRLWAMKVLTRFLLAIALLAILGLLGGFAYWIVEQLGSPRDRLPWMNYFVPRALRQTGEWTSLLIWMIYGFAFGHLAAMLARKSFVAFAIAIPAAMVALAPWIPSLISGGLPKWQLYVVPIAVLALARGSLWAWATDRLMSRRIVAMWSTVAVAAVAFVSACLSFRVYEVPGANVGFDTVSFESEFVSRDKNVVRSKLIQAEDRFNTIPGIRRPTALKDDDRARFSFADRANINGVVPPLPYHALTHGWPREDESERSLNNALMAIEWLPPLREAASLPMQPIEIPKDELLTRLSTPQRVGPIATWMAFHALYLQTHQNDRVSLQLFVDMLSVSRHLQYRATWASYMHAIHFERVALMGLRQWAGGPKVPVELLADALRELRRHEETRPAFSETVKAEYSKRREFPTIAAERLVGDDDSARSTYQRLIASLALFTPWEQARRERILQLNFAMENEAANMSPAQYRAFMSGYRYRFSLPVDTALSDEERVQIHRFQLIGRLIVNDLVVGMELTPSLRPFQANAAGMCDLRATQLIVALTLFQRRHGRPAKSLEELKPDYFQALPIDPHRGQPFQYRVAGVEEWIDWSEDVRLDKAHEWGVQEPVGLGGFGPAVNRDGYRPVRGTDFGATNRRIAAGQALIWSVGEDGVEEGGRRQTWQNPFVDPYALYTRQSGDWIYVVPPVTKN